jgi:spheroidene monooxygenase
MSTTAQAQTAAALSGVVVVLLLDFAAQHRAWGWLRLAQGSAGFRGVPGLRFTKIMGSGHGGGFGLRPSATHQGLVFVLDDQTSAQAFCSSAELQAFVARAREHWLGMLAVTSIRGQWDQQSWGVTPEERLSAVPAALQAQFDANPSARARANANANVNALAVPGLPVAVLTRASIRPAKAMSFWRYAPPAQADLGQAAGCQLAMGLGEAPLVRQCTFSVWDDTASMVAYAHQGAHRQAIAAANRHDFFSESMFARMRVLRMSGVWCGRHYGDAPPAVPAAPASQVAHVPPMPAPIREAAHV